MAPPGRCIRATRVACLVPARSLGVVVDDGNVDDADVDDADVDGDDVLGG